MTIDQKIKKVNSNYTELQHLKVLRRVIELDQKEYPEVKVDNQYLENIKRRIHRLIGYFNNLEV
jgi:hypothetical protein